MTVYRKIYTGGDPNLKASKDYVKSQNWKAAKGLWEEAAKSDNLKVKARAIYNIAVSREVDGDLHGALELAEESNTLYPKGASGNYSQVIRQRIWKNEKVQRDLEEANRKADEARKKKKKKKKKNPSTETGDTTGPSESDEGEVKHRPSE